VTNWNKKAEEILGLSAEQAIGKKLFEISSLLGKERLHEGLIQCQRDKKHVSVKSVSMQNKHGDTMLTNISHMPIIDSHDEPQGAVIVIDDISKIAEMQTELKRKEEELEQLGGRFQETYTQLKLADQEKKANTSDLTRIRTEMGENTKEIANTTKGVAIIE